MLEAVDNTLQAIRKRHPGLPEIVIVLGASGRGKVHGHFAPKSWVSNGDEVRVHEIFLSGESLERGAIPTLGTLLHEVAHTYCHENDIQDTSNAGRYHNAKFKDVAEKTFGLKIDKAPTIGWSVTEVPASTVDLYKSEVAELEKAITAYRSFGLAADTKPKTSPKWVMYCPECNDRVPTGKKWHERNNPMCGNHPNPIYMELDSE